MFGRGGHANQPYLSESHDARVDTIGSYLQGWSSYHLDRRNVCRFLSGDVRSEISPREEREVVSLAHHVASLAWHTDRPFAPSKFQRAKMTCRPAVP
jgi:hypothetical protein